MRLGMNYPWSYNHCGADLGPNPYVGDLKQWRYERYLATQGRLSEIPLPGFFDHLERNLVNLRGMGLDIIRVFLLANGYNYAGTGPTRRNTPPPSPGAPYYDWAFTPLTPADPRFAHHFRLFLKACADHGMQVIPSLISFEFAGNASGPPDGKGLASGGKMDCLRDPGTMVTFLETILGDLLKVSKDYRKQIYAWEVINEPYWNISPFGPLSTNTVPVSSPGQAVPPLTGLARYPELTIEQMNRFLTVAVGRIRDNGFDATVGHRFYRNIDTRSDPSDPEFVTGNRPQFHYYGKPMFGFGDPSQIKDGRLFVGSPKPFLGEFDSALNRFGRPWPELKNNDTTLDRLRLLEREGCELALLWPDLGAPGYEDEIARVLKNDPIKLAAPTRAAVVAFTGGKLPPAGE